VNLPFKLVTSFLCLCLAVPAAYAQKSCSLQTLVGTYAIYEKGASSILDPANVAAFPFFTGATAPFVNVTELTFSPSGAFDGFFWIRLGAASGGLQPIPVQGTVIEMNADCTGKLEYVANVPNFGGATIQERFFLFDGGREFRSVPMSIQNGIDTLAWTGTGHRISKSAKPVHSCGPQTAHGTYLFTAENLITLAPNTALADSLFIREEVALTGEYKGTLYERLGSNALDGLPVSGKYTVNPDCSFTSTLIITVNNVSSTVQINGVFFDEGKQFYALAIDEGIPYSFAQGERIAP
jgi:hypothetical protein